VTCVHGGGSGWAAAAGEGGTANRDWSNWHLGRLLSPLVKYCWFFVVLYQSIVL